MYAMRHLNSENILHLFHDCGPIKVAWALLIQGRVDGIFFVETNWQVWFVRNLSNHNDFMGLKWSTFFGFILYFIG